MIDCKLQIAEGKLEEIAGLLQFAILQFVMRMYLTNRLISSL